MTEQSKRSQWLLGCGCFLCFLLLIAILVVFWIGVCSAVFGPKEPWFLADQIPESVVVLEDFADRTGMDSFFLLKGRFRSEEEITQICDEYLLVLDAGGSAPLSFAGLFDERSDIDWFPLPNVTRRYAFNSVNWDGSIKDNAEGRYESVLWVDDEKKVFILQLACM